MTLTAARLSKGGDSAGHPTGAALKAAGIDAFGIYIVGEFAAPFSVVEDYSAHGIILYSLFERAANAAAGGANQGVIDARDAIVAARARKQPAHSGITFADDNSSVPASTVLDYWRGTAAVRQSGLRNGGYGPHAICTTGLATKTIDLAMVAAGWDSGGSYSGIAIRQLVQQCDVGGVTCDVDEILLEDFGGWNLNGIYPPAPKPAPKPIPTEAVVTTHDLTVKITGATTLKVVAIPFAKVASATMVAGVGPNDCGHVSIVGSGTGTAVVVRGAAKGSMQVVRLGVLA